MGKLKQKGSKTKMTYFQGTDKWTSWLGDRDCHMTPLSGKCIVSPAYCSESSLQDSLPFFPFTSSVVYIHMLIPLLNIPQEGPTFSPCPRPVHCSWQPAVCFTEHLDSSLRIFQWLWPYSCCWVFVGIIIWRPDLYKIVLLGICFDRAYKSQVLYITLSIIWLLIYLLHLDWDQTGVLVQALSGPQTDYQVPIQMSTSGIGPGEPHDHIKPHKECPKNGILFGILSVKSAAGLLRQPSG